MEYPEDFPPDYQAAVEREKIRANQAFLESRSKINLGGVYARSELADCIRKYIIQVALEFSKQACLMGMSRVWTVPQIDYEVHSFLHQVTVEAHNEKRFNSRGIMVSDLAFLNYVDRTILPEEMNRFKSSEEWKTYQEEVLKVSDTQSKPPVAKVLTFHEVVKPVEVLPSHVPSISEATSIDAKKPRRSRDPNPELLKNQNASLTRLQAAEALGMSPRSFDRLKAQKKVVPVGPASRKRYLVKDLQYLSTRKH